MNDAELEELRRDVRYRKDRQAILDCVARYARGWRICAVNAPPFAGELARSA